MKRIPAVIVKAASQADRVDALVDYCRALDGTEIVVLDAKDDPKLPYPHCNNAALHQAALHYKGRPFIWLEPDSIPLKPHWKRMLGDEYRRGNKPFMLSSDENPPHDMIGGIGVYGPDTSWLIPETITRGGWDGWMLDHMMPVTHRTPIIQHSYGIYKNGLAQPHRFPRDLSMIRDNACIFHRDRYQDLVLGGTEEIAPFAKQNRFLHSGDLGDIIAAMPAIRQLGGGQLIITENHERPGISPRESMRGARFEAIKPLLESGLYITGVEWADNPEDITHDFTTFRRHKWNRTDNLAQWQARTLGITDLDMSPWLNIAVGPSGRVVAARSLRYHNPAFPWARIAEKFSDKLLFLGLKEEHEAFEKLTGRRVEWAKTDNLLEVAMHIAAASLGFYNQSAPFWIAAGLGTRLAQESISHEPNSIVKMPKAWYSHNEAGLEAIHNGLR